MSSNALSNKINRQFDHLGHLLNKVAAVAAPVAAFTTVLITGIVLVRLTEKLNTAGPDWAEAIGVKAGLAASLYLSTKAAGALYHWFKNKDRQPLTGDLNKISNKRLFDNYMAMFNASDIKNQETLVSGFHAISDIDRMQDFLRYLQSKPQKSAAYELFNKLSAPNEESKAFAKLIHELPKATSLNSKAIHAQAIRFSEFEKKLPRMSANDNGFILIGSKLEANELVYSINSLKEEEQLKCAMQLQEVSKPGRLAGYIEQFKGLLNNVGLEKLRNRMSGLNQNAQSIEVSEPAPRESLIIFLDDHRSARRMK